MPGQHPAGLSYTLNADWPTKVANSIKKYLEQIPLMQLTDERIENILRGHVATQGRCLFFGPGHPRQLNRAHDGHWELIFKRTKYSKPGNIAVYSIPAT